jgi:hypothetical protein
MFLRRKKAVIETKKSQDSQLTLLNTAPPPSPNETSQFLTYDDVSKVIDSVRNRFSLDRYTRDYTFLVASNQQLKLKQDAQRKIMLAITIILLINQFIMLTMVAMQ